MSKPRGGLDRRSFLRLAASGLAAGAAGASITLVSCDDTPVDVGRHDGRRAALRPPPDMPVGSATLIAAPGASSIGSTELYAAWLFNGQLPGTTLRARRGDDARIRLLNQLPEETIVHWHGLIVPELADGHPRNAIQPGAHYDYAFPIIQRAGTYWYHTHAHHRTAGQIQRGLAGFFIVSDEQEDALDLPRGEREVLLMLQDRSSDAANPFDYAPSGTDHLTGLLGDTPFGNGIRLPRLDVSANRYRLRVLNASHARVYRLALSNDLPLIIVGNDGGLLSAPVECSSVFLGVGERVDMLIDLAPLAVGQSIMLSSLPFDTPTAGERFPQGMPLDLLELVIAQPSDGRDGMVPAMLSNPGVPDEGAVAATRDFVLSSRSNGADHLINGMPFDMTRVDERIELGVTERWRFHNDSSLPHPVHLHGTPFRIMARSGGRNVVYPYEAGWKDTTLVMPLETVEVLVRFENYRGVFPLHCHNLQHEDMGMMMNVEVT
ncbi:MAG TPA: multicopper oxidase domain-containing protein [Longimicrobiales bacterium]